MKTLKIIGLTSILLIGITFLSGCGPATPTVAPASPADGQKSASATVNIKNFSFSPASLTVKAGETVTWVNDDAAPHQIKSETFSSEMLSQGQSFSFVFSQAGNFDYFCSVHPSMKGKIIVQ